MFSSKANTAPKNTSPKRPSGENVNKSNTVPTVGIPMQNETEESVSKTDTNVELKAVGELEFEGNNFWLNLKKGIKVKDYQGSQTEVEPLFNLLIYLRTC